MHSPMGQIRRSLAYIRDHYSQPRRPHLYLSIDGGELQRVTTDAVAALIEENTRRQTAAFRDERR